MEVVDAFDTVTGRRLFALPVSSFKWSRVNNDAGTVEAVVPPSQRAQQLHLFENTRPWRTELCVHDGTDVSHAGLVYKRTPSDDGVSFACEDLWGLLKKRPTLNRALAGFTSGMVPTGQTGSDDSESSGLLPDVPAEWQTLLQGSLRDIAVQFVQLAMSWGPSPVVEVPALTGGTNTRLELGTDLHTAYAQLTNLTGVINGPEVRPRPVLSDDLQFLSWVLDVGSPELCDHAWTWDYVKDPISGFYPPDDSSDVVTDVWAKGGAQDDTVAMGRARIDPNGLPYLFGVDATHSSDSNPADLEAYTRADVGSVQRQQYSFTVKRWKVLQSGQAIPFGNQLNVGDWIDLTVRDHWYLPDAVYRLKVLQLSGDETEDITVEAADRG